MADTKAQKEYIEAVGRRKTAIARVRLTKHSKNEFRVNERELAVYFPTRELQGVAQEALQKAAISQSFSVSALVRGGGSSAQAEAMRLGVARALVKMDSTLRTPLKKAGLLKRDPRSKERRKFGLKKARRAPQWSKR